MQRTWVNIIRELVVTDPFIRSLKDSSFRYWQHLHDILRLLFDPVVKKPNRVNTVVNGEAAIILITQPEHVRLSRMIISMGCYLQSSNDYCRFSDGFAHHLFIFFNRTARNAYTKDLTKQRDWGWKGGGGRDGGLKTKYKGTRRLKINKHSVTPLITFENAFKGICCTSS